MDLRKWVLIVAGIFLVGGLGILGVATGMRTPFAIYTYVGLAIVFFGAACASVILVVTSKPSSTKK